jgi:alkylation response protein AidB-like acyl-CoA dehydrogenase
MAQLIADRRDINFVLYEQLEIEDLLQTEKFNGLNRKMFDMIVSEARNFGIKELLPTCSQGDREGVQLDNGRVTVPACFHRAYDIFVEGEWLAMAEDPQSGGQGLPRIIKQAAYEYIFGANYSLTVTATLGHGTAKVIELFGTPAQKALFLEKVNSGKWAGTIMMTEPEAGSEVSAIRTSAVKNPDGTYSLTGNKIFTSFGDHDLTENIIHPVLARIEGAPEGTRGISLFLVPKIWVNEDGSLGEPNDIVCTGLEEKMGLHGSPTCSMHLGAKGSCRGLLLGQENKGLQALFAMMNEARLDVGAQGFSHGSTAYLYALDYAQQRLQGYDLGKKTDPGAPQVPIINQPDIRRTLLLMKAFVDGMRSLIYYVAYLFDRRDCAESPSESERYGGLIDLLIPVVKAYCSERGLFICDQAVQIYGGYGYTKEYPVEQIMRDCKIATIWEGTNGIQAMDLLGRKLNMNKGRVFSDFKHEIQKCIDLAGSHSSLEALIGPVQDALTQLEQTVARLGEITSAGDVKTAFAHAHPFMEVVGDICMAWMHLWRATVAAPRLEKLADGGSPAVIQALAEKNKEAAYYDGLLKTAVYFVRTMLPITMGKMDSIMAADSSAVDMHAKSFGT